MSKSAPPPTQPATGGSPPLRHFAKSRLMFVVTGLIVGGLSAVSVVHIAALANAPRLELSRTSIDLGEVVPGTSVTETVSLRNTGRSLLTIENVRSSCGCTATKLETMALAPNEATPLTISFIASHSVISAASVTITSNDPRNPFQSVDIVAQKPFSATVSPRTLFFQGLDRASLPTTHDVFVTTTWKDLFQKGNVITATALCKHVSVSVLPQPDQQRYVVKATLLDTGPTGIYSSKIHLADRDGLLNEDVKVDVSVRSTRFLPIAGFVVNAGPQDDEAHRVQEYVVPHRPGHTPHIDNVSFDVKLSELLFAEVIDSTDTRTVIRIRLKQEILSDAVPDQAEGHLLLDVSEGNENTPEVFCIPVTWCRERRAS